MTIASFRGPRTAIPPRLEWAELEPRYQALQDEPLTAERVPEWLSRWSDLQKELAEAFARANNAKNEDTTNTEAESAFLHLVREVMPRAQTASKMLTDRLLGVPGLQPLPQHDQMIRRLRNQADLFRQENVPLLAEATAAASEHGKITGAWTVLLDGDELTVPQANQRLLEPDRALRERVWRLVEERKGQDAGAIHELFGRLRDLRGQVARNAGLPDARAHTWRALNRFDYSPDDALEYQASIEAEVVPILARVREARRRQMGVPSLRPWDLLADPLGRPALRPFETVDELEEGLQRIFSSLDPELGQQFGRLRDGPYLDLEPRRNKVPGLGYCATYPVTGSPYIYWSAVGTDRDVTVLLHEAGHAFHGMAAMAGQDLVWNHNVPMEFNEVASQAMELLALPFLGHDQGGFYSPDDARRWRLSQLESVLGQLANSARNDAFQNWIYTGAPADLPGEAIDRKWAELTLRFGPGVDWRGLEGELARGWHIVPHFFMAPFYYIEYGLAWIGALQVWRNSLQDRAGALRQYREALALGGTRSLPELYAAAGARFAFDRETVGSLMRLVEEQLDEVGG